MSLRVMKRLIIVFSLVSLLSFSGMSQTRKVITETVENAVKKGLNKNSKKAAENISQKISKSAATRASEAIIKSGTKGSTSQAERALIASVLDENALQKFIKRSGFSERDTKSIFNQLGIDKCRRIYTLTDDEMPKELRKIFLSDAAQKNGFYELIDLKPNYFNAYKKVSTMGRSNRTDPMVLEQIVNGKSPVKISTINEGLKGLSKNGVLFSERIITLQSGVKVKGVFAKFPSIFKINLPKQNYLDTDVKQMNYAFLKFQRKLALDPTLQKMFPKDVVEEILSRKLKRVNEPIYGIKGYIWHHSEQMGVLELVPTELHNSVKHTGGKAIWGGGSQLRS